jgi:hypothetical protein
MWEPHAVAHHVRHPQRVVAQDVVHLPLCHAPDAVAHSRASGRPEGGLRRSLHHAGGRPLQLTLSRRRRRQGGSL